MADREYMILAPWFGQPAGARKSREVAPGEIVKLTDAQAEAMGPRLVELFHPERIEPKPPKKTQPKKPAASKGD